MWITPTYVYKDKYAANEENSPMLLPNEITVFFQKCVTMLYYGVSGDTTMLVALGSISYYQPKVTYNTCYDTKWLMYYNYSNIDA